MATADGRRTRWSLRAHRARPCGEEAPEAVRGDGRFAAFDPAGVARALAPGEGWEPVAALVAGNAAGGSPSGERPRERRDVVWEVRVSTAVRPGRGRE